ncbi:MAG: UDP-N-acetylenolpyruvoylglucosamine reductase, partial [Patescibacteria group bacterium]
PPLRSREIISERKKKYPPNLACPGSFFKNVLFELLTPEIQAKIEKSKVVGGKVPAGYLLQAVGACGMREGGIYVADYHGNLIINDGTGTYSEVLLLAQKLKKLAISRFGILLEEEVRFFE